MAEQPATFLYQFVYSLCLMCLRLYAHVVKTHDAKSRPSISFELQRDKVYGRERSSRPALVRTEFVRDKRDSFQATTDVQTSTLLLLTYS